MILMDGTVFVAESPWLNVELEKKLRQTYGQEDWIDTGFAISQNRKLPDLAQSRFSACLLYTSDAADE